MYSFPRFAAPGPAHVARLVRENPFALVITATGGVPVATHVPVIVESGGESTFVGATLLGHMAKVNPQWHAWDQRQTEALVVFSAAHGYVSPTSYAVDPAVPTWDYAAVHLTGLIEPHPDPLDVVRRTVEAMESPRTPSWRPSPASEEVFARIVSGVAAFRVRVTAEQSVFKLSQDKDDEQRHRVRRDAGAAVAALMDKVDPR
ncbi:FMN-binding negative transcriptional regulator [Nonomuraea sp. NEAU-A123]|uniref:FMN-binding negative transcriptional regulator n=1 Tax=Nonomuraea sp. NEAU-A123 TaxID=2839649 RepID=UPI001BE477FA|nr:FMN-binding negative transcriptional regulator [Nonomuraea sp. NEAU-A123]MBT2234193.1 FMN-binding negative transcriptional regulator [Nonomuraea sp. NEAU-A123]